ncbi:ATP-binding cassette domain-containing protein [Achromobacter insolitus]|uniref:ATP-binding cassette domain-containing protein n=1 Tax=Achromobacter insolitus TaxID=217204 RepID=UPI0028A6A025|nr:ATP-binding cassette domain-containing protein [Achromobacter insolitus]
MSSRTMPAASISLNGLNFQYGRAGLFSRRPAPRILHDIDLHVPAGQTIGLVGESGSGKPLAAMPARARARRIQMVFQDPYSSLNLRRTINEILTAPLRVHGIGNAASQAASVRRMMDAVGLVPAFAARYPRELSGGQRQRVAIARALMLEPQLLICDEPTSALDVSVQAQILNLLMELQRERGLGYLFISHNLAVVQHIADEIVVLQGGRVVERGPAAQVYFEPVHPYTRQLIGATLAVPQAQELAA